METGGTQTGAACFVLKFTTKNTKFTKDTKMGKQHERFETPNGCGRVTHVMTEQEYQAGIRFGRERGVQNIWNEPGFVEDATRMEPDRGFGVRTISRKIRVGIRTTDHGPRTTDHGRLTRFGRATFTKRY